MFKEFTMRAEIIEELIGKKTIEHNINKMKFLQEHGYSGLELKRTDEEIAKILYDLSDMDDDFDLFLELSIFEQVLRSNLFVETYQSFELEFIHCCSNVAKKTHQLAVKNINEKNTLIRCREFLTKVAKINIPADQLWKKISGYYILRNCIVHSDAKVTNDTWDFISDLFEAYPLLYYNNIDRRIYLLKGFCEEAIQNSDLFLKDICYQLGPS